MQRQCIQKYSCRLQFTGMVDPMLNQLAKPQTQRGSVAHGIVGGLDGDFHCKVDSACPTTVLWTLSAVCLRVASHSTM